MRNTKMLITLILIAICLVNAQAINFSQQFRVKNFSVNEGLTQFTTGKVIQDQYGLIWVSTYDGLNRYDGDNFIKYRHDPYNKNSISGNRVLEINIDQQRNLWVVTENGSVDKYNYTTDQFEHFKFVPLKTSIVTDFLPDSKGNFWFGTTNGVYKATIKNDEFVVVAVFFNSTTPGYENFITSIVESSNGNIIVGTINSCRFLWHQNNNLYLPGRLLDNFSVNYLFKRDIDETWICTNNGIFILQAGAIKRNGLIDKSRIKRQGGYDGLNIRHISRIDNENFLVCSTNSLYITNLKNSSNNLLKLDSNTFFDNNIINSSIADQTQTIWIGSQQKGIAKIDLHQLPEQIIRHEQTKGMFVKMLFRDSRGRTWIGANFNGLYYYESDDKSLKYVSIPGTVPAYMLFAPTMVEDFDGNLWLSVNEILYKFTNETQKFERFNIAGTKLNAPFSLALDEYKSLWIGCTNGLIRYSFNLSRPLFVSIGNLSDMVSSEQVSRIVYDKRHNIVWACTKDNGVVALFLDRNDGRIKFQKSLKHSQGANSLNSNHVWSLVVASDGFIYIGTDSGLNKCEVRGSDIIVTPQKDLQLIAANKIMSIIEDRSKNLWLGTSQALFSYNMLSKKEKRYTVNNGMFANATLEASFEDKGYIYIGTINGLNIINTNPQPHNPYRADAIITDILISGKSIKSDPGLSKKLKKPLFETDKIYLNYNENSLSINVLATHYNDFEENSFEYQLVGYDKDFNTTDSKNRNIIYNKLPSGKYIFWVKASNNENVWGGKMSQMTIIVRPAPWLSIWAYLGYFIILATIFYLTLKYINKEAKYRQQLRIKDLERQHQEEMNTMRLRFHTNIAHDIRTPITLIAAPLEDIKNDKSLKSNVFLNEKVGIIDKNVNRLLYLVNQFLDFRRLYNSGMKIENTSNDVNTFFSQIKESFDGIAVTKKINFEFIIDINHKSLIFDADKVAKIIINLMSNAFKYTSEGGDVFVFIEKNKNNLRIKIQDSGCGIDEGELEHIFERFYQAKEASSVSGTGIGLALVKQLVDLHHGTIDVESEKGTGTIFTITLPCELPEISEEEETVEDEDSGDYEKLIEQEINHKHSILIVEDDNDLRNYLLNSFNENYKTIEAVNGQDGFDKALRYVPDLIITDIMMPQTDGIQFIKLVRNDYRISHIPILALTAKTGDNNELTVLEAGAEDFIPKPFSTKALRLKVNNYLRDFSKKSLSVNEEPKKNLMGIEEKFLLKMNELILQNLENPIFSIDFICDKMAISRMQLHRKISTLLGKSTSEYIREIKMDVAKKYFEAGDTDVETVMLKIGVSSSFHFNKNFKQRYGISIHQFIKSLHTENSPD